MTDMVATGQDIGRAAHAAPPTLIHYWIHHTAAYDGNTGVQRVVRALGKALAARPDVELVPVLWDAAREEIVTADDAMLRGLARYAGPKLAEPRSAGRPLHMTDAARLRTAWLLIPEVPHVDPDVMARPVLPVVLDYARYYGMRSAFIFYDLIPIRSPGYEAMREAHAEYALTLAAADLILPISRAAGADLEAWWQESGHDIARLRSPRAVPLPAEMVGVERVTSAAGRPIARPVSLLALGTVEPRKNQVALMEAVNRLSARRPDLTFSLDVVGGLHGGVAEAARRAEAESGGRIRLHGYLQDDAVRRLTEDCDATAFVSLAEGYGLPIAESLWQGKPCLCSNVAPMSEIAAGGGCLLVDPHDPEAIERAVERLVSEPDLRRRLTSAAMSRPLSSWDDYGGCILGAMVSAPAVAIVVVAEGLRGGAIDLAGSLERLGVAVRRLRWRADAKALIPGFGDGEDSGAAAPAGDGNLAGLWTVVPLRTTAEAAEAMLIEDHARAIGLKIALLVEKGRFIGKAELSALANVDLALFASAVERDAALAAALKGLPRVATLRHRFRVAADAREVLNQVFAERPRLTAGGVPQLPRRIFYWVQMTATQPFNTGVQRVTRALGAALVRAGIDLIPVKWNRDVDAMVLLEPSEMSVLADWGGPPPSRASSLPSSLRDEWLLHPEITVPTIPPDSNVPALARSLGMRVASIFYDLIPAKLPDIYSPAVVEAFAAYWAGFASTDVVLPISWTVAGDLRRYLADRGLPLPVIVPCVLAGHLPGMARQSHPRPAPTQNEPFRLLAVGTREPRKNYPRLLRALQKARNRCGDRPIVLAIVGRRAGFAELDAEIESLAAAIGDVTLLEDVTDDALGKFYEASHASVYASWEEGFGLPVLESLWRGLPCVCHSGSSLAEVAPGGGTLAVDMLDVEAIAAGIIRLAEENGLLDRLGREAVTRTVRDWDTYASDVLSSLARLGSAPGWALPNIFVRSRGRPLLSCAVTTYNRARWLTHSLPRLIEAAKPFGAAVEVVVCDNASTDATPKVVSRYAGCPGVISRRNAVNVGMLGNLGATARAANGMFVWLIGDDDLVMENGIGAVLEGLEAHPDVEMAYLNYAYTSFDEPEELSDPGEVIRGARRIGFGGPNRRVDHLRDVAAYNENLFTAIYACVFRRDHAMRAYQQDVTGAPFSSLATCVPSSTYALSALQDRPAWWVGQPAIVVNMNVSWLRWALLWHLERMPDLFDAAELAGIDPVRLDRHRHKHCWNAGDWTRAALWEAEDAIRRGVSVARLLERCKHIPSFGPEVAKVLAAYRGAWTSGRVEADDLAPRDLFARYGLDGPMC